MTDKINQIKTSQGVITYEPKDGSKNAEFKVIKDDNKNIQIFGKDVNVYLPENTASNITLRSDSGIFGKDSKNVSIIDGAEKDGKAYSDRIVIKGDNNSYEAARKTVNGKPNWAKDHNHGDSIFVTEGVGNSVIAKSGNNVFVSTDSNHTRVEVHQGSYVQDAGFGTTTVVKSSPHTKGEKISSRVEVKGSSFSTVIAEKGTFVVTESMLEGEIPTVINYKGNNITQLDDEGRYYYIVE